MFPKVGQKVIVFVFYWKSNAFLNSQKRARHLGYFWNNIFHQNFKKWPNLVTLTLSLSLTYSLPLSLNVQRGRFFASKSHSCEGQKKELRTVWPDVEISSDPIIPIVTQNESTEVLNWKVPFFKIAPKVTKYLGFFLKIFCSQDLSKIAKIRSHCLWTPFLS